MASTKAKREKRKKRTSASRWTTERKSGFERTAIKIPEGVTAFKIEKAVVHRLEIVEYEVAKGAGNPYAEDGDLHFERTFFTHRGIGADGNVYVCPAKTAGKKCPICEHRQGLIRDNGDEDMIKSLAPKERQLFNVFDHKNADAGVQVWDISFHLFGKLMQSVLQDADEDDDYEYFADQEDGKTLKVGFEEKTMPGNSRPFYEARTIEFKNRREPLDSELYENANILDDLLIILPYDKLKAIFLQVDEDDSSDKNDSPSDPPPKARKKAAKKPDPVEDESDDDDKSPPATAKEAGLETGMAVMYDEDRYTIIKISKDGTSLTLIDDEGVKVKAIGVDEVERIKAAKKAPAKKKAEKEADPVEDDPEPESDNDDDDDDSDGEEENWDDDEEWDEED